jgi:hypothetical protein
MLSVYVCTHVSAVSAFEQIDHVHEIWNECYAVGGHSNGILSIYGSTVLCWALAAFQFLNPMHSR